MTAPRKVLWPADRELAERYAALRHPALARVTVTEADGQLSVATTQDGDAADTAAARSPLAVEAALQATGEAALGLAALHELGLTLGGLGPGDLLFTGSGWRVCRIALPGDAAARQADVGRLAELLPALTGHTDDADARAVAVAAAAAAPSATAADVGRTALALARGDTLPAATPTRARTEAAAAHAAARSAELDARRRRTRNRMLLVGGLVVIAGAVLLKLVDSQGIVTVPDETGRTTGVATADLRSAGLVPHLVRVPATAGQAAGTVIGEAPGGGAHVRPGRTVTLRVAAPRASSARRP